MRRSVLWLGVVSVLAGSRVVLSGTVVQGGTPQAERPKADVRETMPLKDVIDKAFELPRGAVLLGNQIRAYGELRKQFEPALRSALERVALAENEEEKLQATTDVRKIREAIRLGMQEVLKVPPTEPKDASKAGKGKKPDPPKKGADKKPNQAHKDGNKKPDPPKKAEPKKPAEKKKQAKPAGQK